MSSKAAKRAVERSRARAGDVVVIAWSETREQYLRFESEGAMPAADDRIETWGDDWEVHLQGFHR